MLIRIKKKKAKNIRHIIRKENNNDNDNDNIQIILKEYTNEKNDNHNHNMNANKKNFIFEKQVIPVHILLDTNS